VDGQDFSDETSETRVALAAFAIPTVANARPEISEA